MLVLSSSTATQGPRNAAVQALEWVVSGLKARVAEKERQIASAHLVSVSTQLAAAEENESQLRKAAGAQRAQLIDLGPQATEYAKLETDVARITKECELLDGRIAEVRVNDLEAAPLNVQFLEPARRPVKPIKPNKLLIMGIALMAGWVIGIGLALTSEWKDSRLRTPTEILTLLNTPVLATVPPINARLSSVAQGTDLVSRRAFAKRGGVSFDSHLAAPGAVPRRPDDPAGIADFRRRQIHDGKQSGHRVRPSRAANPVDRLRLARAGATFNF